MQSHEAKDTALPHTALAVAVASDYARDHASELCLQVLCLTQTNNLERERERGREGERERGDQLLKYTQLPSQ